MRHTSNFKHDLQTAKKKDWTFIKLNVLPSLQYLELHSVLKVAQKCKSDGLIIKDRWKLFQTDPSKMCETLTSNEILFNFQCCWEKVVESASALSEFRNLPETLCFKYPPNVTGLNERYGAMARPDSAVCLKESSVGMIPEENSARDKFCWPDTAVPIEFRSTGRISTVESIDDRKINASKLCWTASNIFTVDHCRDAVYGITIENTTLRLWNFTRAGLIVSEDLNWIEDHESFIYLVISLAFADKTSLGYDPSIKRVWVPESPDQGNLQYSIAVGKTIYQTTGAPLSDHWSNLINGCATRIYKVFQIKPIQRETISTLKITWNHSGTVEEGVQLDNLRVAALKKGCGNADIFLTPKTYERCIDTEYYARKEFYENNLKVIKRNTSGASTPEASSSNTSMSDQSDAAVEFTGSMSPPIDCLEFIFYEYHIPRFQYRIVFAEVGIPLHQIDNISDYFYALGNAVFGLFFLHDLGFVHRDLNTSNVVIATDGLNRKTVKLAEFGYMRSIDVFEEVEDPMFMGSSEFAAVEIQERLYLFREAESGNTSDCSITDYVKKTTAEFLVKRPRRLSIVRDTTIGSMEITERNNGAQQDLNVPVHNAIHDLEAFFWMGLWFLCHRVPNDYGCIESVLEGQINAANRIFTIHNSVTDPPPDRRQTLLNSAGLKKVLATLPSQFHNAADCLKIVRNVLQKIYVEKESNPNWNGAESMTGILPVSYYYSLRDIFIECRDTKSKIPVKPISIHGRNILSPYGKRKSEDGIEEFSSKKSKC